MDKIFFILNGIRGWRTWNCDNDLFSSISLFGVLGQKIYRKIRFGTSLYD